MTAPTKPTHPTAKAMKAAELFWLSTGDHGVQELAVIIDRCTGLPALLADKELLDWADREGHYDARYSSAREELRDQGKRLSSSVPQDGEVIAELDEKGRLRPVGFAERDALLAENKRLRDIVQDMLWKLEHFHEFGEPERNAFIYNTPMHLRAALSEGDKT